MADLHDLTLDELKPRLLEAMLPHVPFDGWSDKALASAAADLGIAPATASLVFPDGQRDMMVALADWTKDHLRLALADGKMLTNMKIRDKIRLSVRTRFETVLGTHKEAIRKGSHIMAMPRHAALTAKLTWAAADDIWRMCGDTATDYNHYTKRAILTGVLGAISLSWLADETPDAAATWALLDRQIDGIMQFEKTKARLLAARETMPSLSRFLGRLRYPAV
jgi:ubiquinone biosynthesis protein COQ9